MKIRIIIDNNRSRVVGSKRAVVMLHKTLRLRAPGYFYSPAWRSRAWDGYIKYVTETGTFATGLLDQVCKELKKLKYRYELEDSREHFKDLHEVTALGDLESRPYQLDAVKATLNNRFETVKFIRGILHEATNAGKNLIAASIMASFAEKRTGLFLIDNKEIFEQAVRELGELLPGQIGQVKAGYSKWGRLTICMVQSLANLLKKDRKAKARLAMADIVLVDECDTTANLKTGKYCLGHCTEAPIRIGLSGTPLVHKDKTRNQNILAIFGPVIHRTSNKELVDQGYSAKPIIKFIRGNTKHIYPGDYAKEYRRGIVKSRERAKITWRIVARAIRKEQTPVLILIKLHKQAEYLLKYCPGEIMDAFTIESVNHTTSNRVEIFKRFNDEKIPILISSMIIRRGKNIPIIRTLINAAGGDSQANALQLFGRLLRKLEGKKEKAYMFDFNDMGKYLQRHSKHRILWYKNEGFPINLNTIIR